MTMSKALFALLSIPSASAFLSVASPKLPWPTGETKSGKASPSDILPTSPTVSSSTTTRFRSEVAFRLHALIYGWDDGADDDSDESSSTYSVLDASPTQCSPAGIAMAETLSYDQDRVGSLARLAVAFAPPGQGLELDQIENIDVICVSHDHIDIQAIVCEDGGCVSLAVPVSFPYECESSGEWLQGCVIQNLEELDMSAQSTIQQKQDQGNTAELNQPVNDFPLWWVSPSTTSAAMDAECVNMRSILNEDDFQQDVMALAQLSLSRASSDGYVVKAARVAAVGPAGLAFKVKAEYTLAPDRPAHFLDVLYPFGGQPLNDVEALRAAVLGAVATAE